MIYPVKHPKQSSWEIIYKRFDGFSRRAVEFLSRELGKFLLRETDLYKIFVLPCKKECEETEKIQKNAVIVGLWDESQTVRRFIQKDELNGNDYLVKVVVNPDDEDGRLVIITAKAEKDLFYGAVAFVDNYTSACAPIHGGLRIPQWRFDYKMPEYTLGERAKIQTRSVFTWGHPINDYRAYIRDLARLKLNQVIIWNDYMPVNADDIVAYAHSYGLEVIWGYSWGWNEGGKLTELSDGLLQKLKEKALAEYENHYKNTHCDGIYFQSFTEMSKEYIGDKLIARAVTDFVNDTANEFFKRYPKMKIQFGLHATSVKNHLDELAHVDKRVEILWEDCGAFPYNYTPIVRDEKQFEDTLELTKKIIALRGDAPLGLVVKGFMTLDWEMFVHQSGPFIMGENDGFLLERDAKMRKPIWQVFNAGWTAYGEYALRLIREAYTLTNGKINICMAGAFDGEIALAQALCAEMAFDPTACEFKELLHKVSSRQAVLEYK